MNAIGVGEFPNLESVKGEYVINAGGGISYRYQIFFFGDEGRKDEYNNVLTADYQTSTGNKLRANEFKKQANDQYSKLYHEYKGNNPILIRIDTNAGHGGGKPISKWIEEKADVLGFLLHHTK